MSTQILLSDNNDSGIHQCGFCDMWGTVIEIFKHMQKEHPQLLDDDVVDSDEEELNNENDNIIRSTRSDEITSSKIKNIYIVKGISYFCYKKLNT